MMKNRCLSAVVAGLALCCGTAMSASAQSANNDCVNAVALSVDVPVSGTIVAADTNDGPTNTATSNGCTATFFAATNKTVWYSFTPATSGLYEFSMCASAFDSLMAIYPATSTTPGSAAPCTGSVAAIACNDDSCGTRSNFNANLTAGQGYLVRVSPFGTGTGGAYVILVHGPQSTPPPSNDDCLGAITLANGVPTAGDLTNATGSSTTLATCGSTSTTGNDVWYNVTTPGAGTASIDVCGNFDSVASVYTAASTCGTLTSLACNDDTLPTGCTLHGSRVTWTAVAGASYFIRVAGVQPTGTVSPAGSFAPAHGGFTVTFTAPLPSGTCCNNFTGACTFVTQTVCGTGGTWTLGGACTPSPCPATGSCCIGQCCTVLVPAACTNAGGTFTAGGTCAVGSCTAVVANDECTGALPLTLGTPVIGGNCGATKGGTEVAPTCQSSFGASVWYSFSPAASGFFNLSTCGSSFDCVLDVFTSPDCVAFTSVACDDDTCAGGEAGPIGTGNGLASVITGLQMNAGTTYFVRLSGFGTATGTYTLTVSANTVAGACCNTTTGACTVSATGAAGCGAGTTFTGGVCTPNPCPQPSGACCTNDGNCSIQQGADCVTAGGIFQGPASACSGSVCPVVVGSCCNNTSGVCTYILGSATCTGGTFTAGGVCSPDTCPKPGACCIAGCCSVTLQAACTGTWGPANSTCTAGICGAPANNECAGATPVTVGANAGSNCGATTSFIVSPETQCGTTTGAGGARDVFHTFTPAQSALYTINTCATPGFDSTLALYNSCPVDGTVAPVACNDDTAGTCAVSTLRSEIPNQPLLAGVTYIIRVAAWGGGTAEGAYVLNIAQGASLGSCCVGTSCSVTTSFNCTGTWTEFGSCSPDPCAPSTGACCQGTTCSTTTAAACTGVNTIYAGNGTVCNAFPSALTPCCLADYNHLGGITVQDIFDFLAGYFNNDPFADINGGGLSVQDIFDFLNAYFSGGC